MNKVKNILLVVVLILCASVVYAKFEGGGFAPSSTDNVKTSTECNAAAYYAVGTLCQDTDDNKLYLGTGAAVLEILSTTTGYALDAELSALAGLTSAANAIPYFTGSGTAGVISSSADMVSLLGSADYATARTNLGLGTLATQNADAINATGGNVTGLTNLGASNATLTNLTVSGVANVTGSLTANVTIITDSATANVTAAQMMGQTHVVTGAYTLSLPTAALGYNARFFASTAAAYSIDVVTGTDIIVLNGTALTAGYKATSDGTIDAAIYCECIVAGKYICTATQGLFIDGGA